MAIEARFNQLFLIKIKLAKKNQSNQIVSLGEEEKAMTGEEIEREVPKSHKVLIKKRIL